MNKNIDIIIKNEEIKVVPEKKEKITIITEKVIPEKIIEIDISNI